MGRLGPHVGLEVRALLVIIWDASNGSSRRAVEADPVPA